MYIQHTFQFESYDKFLSCDSGEEAEPISVDFHTILLSTHCLHHVRVEHQLPAVVVEVDLGVDRGEGGEGTVLELRLAHPVEHVLRSAEGPGDGPVQCPC